MKILGIDPGLNRTGWAVLMLHDRTYKYIDGGVIITDPSHKLQDRLLVISNTLNEILLQHKPNTGAIEETYVNKNFASSLKLAHARAASMLVCGQNNIKILEYPAKTVKKTLVGSGSADKDQMMRMLELLMPGIKISNADTADAIAIAICHANHLHLL